ncbi:TetR family transcriptional regulator [Streptomyces sp. NRRL F-4489]|uniref:TetR/AcrR family transcriptional regulator n=1 Tax=Streptomyces sp. NRRL F-4489 TaxID=1609095 RepID=UPI000747F111|nr:TetR/AcrR family transcriptional regulator [Streptomyces sp. NRRL F-4489]KUL55464.1 TetR family transcriptional regulator [Streptomyces sp. NRRL F-4489]
MERAERGERILEAAGELLLAWGYRRVTIDEIARRANVGKGTVYLHWKTKDSLMLAVVLKAKWRSQRRQLARMRADPRDVLPSRMMRGFYLDFLAEPVLRALYTDDADILGQLNDTAKKEFAELMELSDQALRGGLEVLRNHGLVRADTDLRHQQYALLSMSTGFFMAEAMLYDRAPDSPEVRGDIFADTVRRALEISPEEFAAAERPAAARGMTHDEAVAAAAPGVIALYARIEEHSTRELRRHVRD